jgi:hypothetical protein
MRRMQTQRAVVLAAIFAALLLALVPGRSLADDQGVFGTRLVIIDKHVAGRAKIALLANDNTPGAIHNGSGSGNPADVSGTVRICQTAAPANVAVFDAPSPWVVNTTTVSRYANPLAAIGGPGARVLKVIPNLRLKMIAKNLGDGDATSADDGPNDLALDFGAGYCNISLGENIDVEAEVVDAATTLTHHMCTTFSVDVVKSILGGAGCKVIAKLNVPSLCGVC